MIRVKVSPEIGVHSVGRNRFLQTDIMITEGRLNAQAYLALIREQLEEHGDRTAWGNFVLQ